MKLLILLISSSFLMANIELPKSFHSTFLQKITNTEKKTIKYSGEVYFSNKKNFRWSYLKPTKKDVCTNGKELLVVDHDLEQVYSYYLDKGLDINAVLEEAKIYDKKQNIYVAEYEGRRYTIKLSKNQKLHSIAYFDALDNKVQILFTNMEYKTKNISKNKMFCHYPKSYDKIEG